MKESVEEWHGWKDRIPTAAPSSSTPALDQLCQVIDVYQDLLAVIAKYMNEGDEGEIFLESQLEDHPGVTPDSLALNNLEELAESASRSASLLIGRDRAMDLKREILNLRSHYIERDDLCHEK